MIKKLVGKLFGFEKEILDLRQQVQELSWDSSFGMWTRGAFLQFCDIMPRGRRIVVFIDLDQVHDLNEELGYTEVDRRVKATFSMPFRRSDVVARWYSGDEIVILFDTDREGAERKISQLEKSAASQGMAFQFEVGEWEVGKTVIEDVVSVLADRLTQRKMATSRAAWRRNLESSGS